nr:PREDICTED: PTB domain-containing engulfment adapter protein 1 [Bos indicus]
MNRAFSRKKDKTWMHTPEALSKHYIPYNAKFLGSTEVEQPKGTEVVRDAVRKLKVSKPSNYKTRVRQMMFHKLYYLLSWYSRKRNLFNYVYFHLCSQEVQHNCQLHRISFCADDKTDKRIFTFICKDSESNKHLCYVFDSEKCAEEITLTIGQAFDLAYRKFLESGGKDVETRKQIAGLQKRIQDLETENMELKNKVQDLENQLRITHVSTPPLLHKMSDHEQHGFQRCSPSFWHSTDDSSPCLNISSITVTPVNSPDSRLSLGLLIPPPSKRGLPKPDSDNSIPRPHLDMTELNLLQLTPYHFIHYIIFFLLERDLFGAEPFDPFNCGAGDFPPDIQSKLDEMQEGFKMGLTLEGTVFCLDPLDSRC